MTQLSGASLCEGATVNIGGTAEGIQMPSNIIRNPIWPDDDFKAQQELEFDRWRTAVTIVKRMREAGISCELFNNLENGH